MKSKTAQHTTCLIATVRNEGPWLLEWIAHNRAVGFDNIVVASNDCDDGTDKMLDRLMELGHLRHFRNYPPYRPHKIQMAAYERARRFPEVANAEWVLMLDADEFLNLHIGAGTLPEFLATLPEDCDAVAFCWRVFGDSGLSGWIDTTICETLTQASSSELNDNSVKVMTRKHHEFPAIGAHTPLFFPETPDAAIFPVTVYSSDLQKLPADRISSNKRHLHNILQERQGWSAAQINHYILKTWEIYQTKKSRGSPTTKPELVNATRYSREFFDSRNRNECTDTTISRTAGARHTFLEAFMKDEVLAELHNHSVECKLAQLDLLRETR